MTKRISCFLLALVMVLLAVPVFVLPATAANELPKTHVTSWTNNQPKKSGDNGVAFSGGWSNGIKVHKDTYVPFDVYDTTFSLIRAQDYGSDSWTYGGYYINQQMITPKNAASSIRYVAEYTGTATVSVNSLKFKDGGSDGLSDHAYVLVHNSKVVWPVGATYDNVTTWFTPEGRAKDTQVADKIDDVVLNLTKGDTVEFVFTRIAEADASWGAYGFAPVVSYTEISANQTYRSAFINNLPAVSSTNTTAVYPGTWRIGYMRESALFPYEANNVGGGHLPKTVSWSQDRLWYEGGMYTAVYGTNMPRMIVTPGGQTNGIQYIAEYDGAATLSFDSLFFDDRGTVEEVDDQHTGKANVAMVIMKNRVPVWPADAAYTDVATWYYPDSKVLTDVSKEIPELSLTLARGDKIEILFRKVADAPGSWSAYAISPVVTYADTWGKNAVTGIVDSTYYGSEINVTFPKASDAPFYGDGTAYGLDLSLTDEEEIKANAAEAQANYVAILNEATKVTFTGNWSAGVIDKNYGTYERIARLEVFAAKKVLEATGWDHQWCVTESAYQKDLAGSLKGTISDIWNGYAGVMCAGAPNKTQPSNNTPYTFAYEMPQSGLVAFEYEKLSVTKNVYLAVFVDGCMVWPTVSGGILDKNAYYPVAAGTTNADTVNAALATCTTYVEEGSLVEFAVIKGAWGDFYFEPVVHIMETEREMAVVSYTDFDGKIVNRYSVEVGSEFPTPAGINAWDINGDGKTDKLPATVTESVALNAKIYGAEAFKTNGIDNMKHSFRGNWTFTHGDWSSDDITDASRTWTRAEETATWNGGHYTFPSKNNLWGANVPGSGGLYVDGKIVTKSGTNGLAVLYTAPASGFVDLDIAQLIMRREKNNTQIGAEHTGPISLNLSIVKNGEVIWPTEGSAFKYVSTREYNALQTHYNYNLDLLTAGISTDVQKADDGQTTEVDGMIREAAPAFPTSLYLAEGDELAFVVNSGASTTWFCYINPIIEYTELIDAPEVNEASVALNEKFAANFLINEATVPAGATNVGAYVNGVFMTAEAGITLSGIAAKEIADKITVETACTYKGVEMRGKAKTYSVADILMQYVERGTEAQKNLAIATLNYAAAAQTYFDYNTENLANAGLTEAQKNVAYTGEYSTECEIKNAEEKPIDFYGVKLILEDSVRIAVYFVSETDLTEGYTAWCESTNTSPVTNAEIKKVGINIYKVIFDGFMPTSWNTKYSFWLTDSHGVQVSGDLMYSVSTYCARMQDHVENGAKVDPVVDAMLALYEAADAYKA